MSALASDEEIFRIKWQDIERVPQDDGPNPVVAINYSPKFTELMDLFRGIQRKGEISERVLELTTELLSINPANYTVWKYRRDCLKNLRSDLREELKYMDNFAEDNPKNYQIWYHRRAVVELLGDGSTEKEFTRKVFEVDSKNYHAWAHRQWAVLTYGLNEGELDYTTHLIDNDCFNNSAWNHRWFIIHLSGSVSVEVLDSEVRFCFDNIIKAPKNDSVWNYARGLYRKHADVRKLIEDRCLELKDRFEASEPSISSPPLYSLLADILENKKMWESALRCIECLMVQDKLRAKFWRRRYEKVMELSKVEV